jgi:hypothetical protein
MAMPKLPLVVLAFIVSSPTLAQQTVIPLHVFERPEVTMNLMPGPCVDPVSLDLARRGLPPQNIQNLKAIASNWLERDGSRKDYAGCWLDLGAGFLVIFSDKTYDVIPKDEFKKMRGQRGA